MSDNFDLKKLFHAGVGAVVAATEKSKEIFDDLSRRGSDAMEAAGPTIDEFAKKGEEAMKQGSVFNEEIKAKVQCAFDKIKAGAQQLDVDEIIASLGGLTDDAITNLRDKIDEYLAAKASAQPGETAPEQTANECEESCECGQSCECEQQLEGNEGNKEQNEGNG